MPIHNIGGSLRAYAKNAASTASFKEIKEAAWEVAVYRLQDYEDLRCRKEAKKSEKRRKRIYRRGG